MSFLNLFGYKKNNSVTPEVQVTAIEKLRDAIKMLEKRENFLETRSLKLKDDAKTALKTNKRKAIYFLKKSKMDEKQLETLYGQKENLELQLYALGQGMVNMNTLSSIKEGANALKTLNSKIDVDTVEDLMDDISDGVSTGLEISNAMSRPVGETYDESDLLEELEREMKEPAVNFEQLPNVPQTPVQTTEEKELKELEELMEIM